MSGILLTGAGGLIGRRVVEAFGGEDLIALRGADVDLLAPGAWPQLLDRLRPATIVHLAWSASGTPGYRDHDDNWRWADSTLQAAGLAAGRGIRFIATGTAVDDVAADDAYSRAKAQLRDALSAHIDAGELTWLRPFYVFDESPGDDRAPSPAVLRAALAAKAAGEPAQLASPDASHDFIHAIDTGTAIRTVVGADLTGAIDLGSGATTSVADLVEAYGCTWVRSGTPSSAAANDGAAEVAELMAAGWTPAATRARLG